MRRLGAALAFVSLVASALPACTSTANISDVYMALDGDGNRKRNIFYTDTQSIHCVVEAGIGRDGATVEVLIRQVQRFDLDNGKMGWDYVGGDLKECTGRYQFTPTEDGATEVAIDIVTETGFFVPGPMKKLIRDQSLKNSMRDLKKRVEK